MSENRRVLVDLVLGARADAVWAALREPDQIERWFGWDYDGLAAEIRQIFVDDVEADQQAGSLAFPDGDRIVLDPQGDDRTGLRVLRNEHPAGYVGEYDPIDEGWITFTQQLRFGLERHRGQARRTVSALGVGLGPQDDPLLARLGIRLLGDEPVGSGYTVDRADGTQLGGEIFFQTDLQLGLTVEQEGDALLVIARTPPSSAPPDGAAMFVLSTYGQDDAGHAATEEQWTGWWGSADVTPAQRQAPSHS